MDTSEIIDLTSELIRIQSISNMEMVAADYLATVLETYGFSVERQPVDATRSNILACCGTPEILFSTHMDVVPAQQELYSPRFDGARVYGRGACDAKGIIACMIAAARALKERGVLDFGLLFVVGEETSGDGARAAAKALKGLGIKYIINGEPTECRIATAHKGALGLRIGFSGRSCHSGYPELGEDANAKLTRACSRLMEADFGLDAELGKATLNIGLLSGGTASNTLSDRAELRCTFRTVGANSEVLQAVKKLVNEASELVVEYDAPCARMLEVPGFESFTASYCTDIPNFAPLGAKFVLYGPGSILTAHSDNESIGVDEIEKAVTDYQKIFAFLKDRIHRPQGEKN